MGIYKEKIEKFIKYDETGTNNAIVLSRQVKIVIFFLIIICQKFI